MADGCLNMLLNNAAGGYSMPLVHASLDTARELFDLNVWAILGMTQAFLPLLLKSEYGGMIVNHTSTAGCNYVPMLGVYNASKAATITITGNLCLELEPFGIKVVELRTGAVKFEFFNNQNLKSATRPVLPEHSMYGIARDEIEKVMRGDNIRSVEQGADEWAQEVVGDLMHKNPPVHIWRGGRAWLAWSGTYMPRAFLEGIMRDLGGTNILKQRLLSQGKQ